MSCPAQPLVGSFCGHPGPGDHRQAGHWFPVESVGDRITSLEGVWRTGVRAVELETLMLVSSRGYPLLTMVNGPLKAWRSWPDSYRSRPVRAAATTSAPWCCSPFRALPGASSAWPLSGWTRPLLPPTRLLPNPGTDGFRQGRLRVYMNHAPWPGSGCPTVTDGLDRHPRSSFVKLRA